MVKIHIVISQNYWKMQKVCIKTDEIIKIEDELKEVRHRLFNAKTSTTKKNLRDNDKKLREKMTFILKSQGWSDETAHQLSNWDPYDQNASSLFFDPEWMFGITYGFDIVIGNPPYLESRHPSFNNNLKFLYQQNCKKRWNNDSEYITKGADLLIYFFEVSLKLISSSGNVVFITQNAWLDTEYGFKAQKFFEKHTNVKRIIDSIYRYFPSGEGPNINTIIILFIGNNPNNDNIIQFYLLKENIEKIFLNKYLDNLNYEDELLKVNSFKYSDKIFQKYKWGILHSSDAFVLELIKILEDKGLTIENIPSISKFSFGQGLNLSKSCFIPKDVILNNNINIKDCFPILYSGTPYQLESTDWFLVRKDRVSKETIKILQKIEYDVFDTNSTRKIPPVLILPRGISKHFCCLNNISAYSLSAVDVYSSNAGDQNDERIIKKLWLFFNSSLFWLLREVSGRKNLGGGLLKSEATDLNVFPIYFDLEINTINLNSFKRDTNDTLVELESSEHKSIDKIIFDYLNLSHNERDECLKHLSNYIQRRYTKAST
jgi:hypothetical protein